MGRNSQYHIGDMIQVTGNYPNPYYHELKGEIVEIIDPNGGEVEVELENGEVLDLENDHIILIAPMEDRVNQLLGTGSCIDENEPPLWDNISSQGKTLVTNKTMNKKITIKLK